MGDDFMNNYDGSGNTPQIYPFVDLQAGRAFCDLTSVTSAYVKTVKVTFDYEAWFTGNVDDASLALNIKHVDAKLLGYLASSARLCDTLACTSASSINCIEIYNRAGTDGNIVGVSKTSVDIIQTKYECEQARPTSQLPVFNRIVCIPVNSTLSVTVPAKFSDSQTQAMVWKSIETAMASGKLNTDNEVVGLVFTGTPHTKMSATGGTVKKEMRPLGIGLLVAGSVIVFFLLVGSVTWLILKRRKRMQEEEDYEDLSLDKDRESASYPADSFDTAILSPNSTGSYDMSSWKATR